MGVVKPPCASGLIDTGAVATMPWLHPTWTGTPAGKSAPCATTMVPGGPTAGESVSVGFGTAGGPAPASGGAPPGLGLVGGHGTRELPRARGGGAAPPPPRPGTPAPEPP